jgi:hypothetical protein
MVFWAMHWKRSSFRLSASECMRLDQRKVTEALGIMEIAKYGNMPESNILNDVGSISVTRSLALILIDQLAEFKYLISQEPRIHPDQSEPPKTLVVEDKKNLRFISLPSNKCQERTLLLNKATEHLLLKDPPDLLNVRCIWQKLLHQQSIVAY